MAKRLPLVKGVPAKDFLLKELGAICGNVRDVRQKSGERMPHNDAEHVAKDAMTMGIHDAHPLINDEVCLSEAQQNKVREQLKRAFASFAEFIFLQKQLNDLPRPSLISRLLDDNHAQERARLEKQVALLNQKMVGFAPALVLQLNSSRLDCARCLNLECEQRDPDVVIPAQEGAATPSQSPA